MSMRYMKWLIRCVLESKTLSNEDHELLLECTKRKWNWDEHPPLDVLLHVRRCWDISLSRVISPSERFSKCLSLFCGPLFEDLEDMPLLICGKGRVEDVIKFHTLMDKNSINGPLVTVDGDFPPIFPKTIIGFWLDRYLRSAFNDMVEAGHPYSIGYGQPIYTAQLEHIVRALLDVQSIDVSPFFESLDSCSETFYAYDVFKPGMSIVDCMKRYSKWWLNEYESPIGPQGMYDQGERIEELNWIFAKLVAAKEKKETNKTKKKSRQKEMRFGRGLRRYLWGRGTSCLTHIG